MIYSSPDLIEPIALQLVFIVLENHLMPIEDTEKVAKNNTFDTTIEE